MSHQIIEDEAGTFWFEGISADSYALQIEANGTFVPWPPWSGHLEVSGNAPVHGHDHHATLDQRQLTDCQFVGVRLGIVNVRVFDKDLTAVTRDKSEAVEVITIEIERTDDALGQFLQI